MLWACIELPELAMDAILRRHPEPDRPLAIVGGHPQRRELIAVNDAAARAGLHPGQRMTLAQAISHDFGAIDHDPAEAERWQRFLAAWAYRYSSQVLANWPGAIVLEAERSFGLFGDWPRFEAQLRADLTALGFRHSIALAPTPRAARVLSGVRDGIAILQSDHLRNALGSMPVRRAALPNGAGDALHGVGIRELRQVFALPRASLRRRFGQDVLDHLDRLLGDVAELIELYQPPDRFDMRIELAYEVEQHPPLLFPVRRLTADLAAYLAGRDGGVQHFILHLEHEGHPATPVEIGLLAAERDAALLFELTRSRLERVQIPVPVVALRLVARQLPPFVPAGRDLFDEQVGAVPWDQLRERLRARLGNEAVYNLIETTDPRPERACRRSDGTASAAAEDRPTRPTWLLPRPIPLRDPAPRILAGPERIETGWWDGEHARRDYYVLETAFGQRAWAFAPVNEQGPWMLHGWFA
ncbi:MAG TPA: DNA polymerase Y family protein [Fontimonas sp.]